MDLQEILAHLKRDDGDFPRMALQEAVARREEITPALLEVLEEAARDPASFAADGARPIHFYAMFLLAQFREPRAYPLLVRIFSAPRELPFQLVGDVVTGDLSRLLASVSGGDPSGLKALIENESANEYVRSAALDGLLVLVATGRRTRHEVMAYFSSLFRTLERRPSLAWDGLVAACADLCPLEVQEDIRKAYDEGLVDPGYIAWEEIPEALALGPEAALEELRRRFTLIDDAIKEMERWAGSCEPQENAEDDEIAALLPWLPQPDDLAPFRRAAPKVGRNDPCPCGSGKKFKKCCGR